MQSKDTISNSINQGFQLQPNGEVRIPNRMLIAELSRKKSRALQVFAYAKWKGHRVEIEPMLIHFGINNRTGKRLIKYIIKRGWAGSDGKYLFPRSWRRLNLSKRGGLYFAELPIKKEKFEALVYTHLVKKQYRKLNNPRLRKKKALPEGLSSRYISIALKLSERRSQRLKASAIKFGLIRVKRNYKILGKANQQQALSQNLHGISVFRMGKFSVCPDISTFEFIK